MTEKLESMYKLAKNFETALSMVDEDGVLSDEAIELINKAEMDITQKTENIFKILRFLNSRVDLMKEEKSYINDKQNIVKKNIEKLRELMAMGLDTVVAEFDKNGKKTQKIKTDKGSVYYTFKNEFEFNENEIEDKYIIKKTKLRLNENFDLERLKELAPKMLDEINYTEIDYELLQFDYERAIKDDKTKVPTGIKIEELKTLCVRK